MATVAVDGFGADRGVPEVERGVALAAGDGIGIRLFAPEADVSKPLADGVELVPAEDFVSNEEEPVRAVRAKPGASIVLAAADVAADRSQALVSAGSTGAAMAAALGSLRRLKGVHRPALAVTLPIPGRQVLFLDAGANVEVRPQHLVQFAYMGAAFSQAVLGIERPKVALLSVGEEPGKGTPDVVAAHAALAGSEAIDFAGNVEGRDLTSGAADVVVTDGFTGNVALKVMEGTAKTVAGAIRDAARSNPLSAAGGLMLKPALGRLRQELDPDTTGGAILLGVRGVVVVAHGSSSAEGIANAIRLADRAVREGALERTAALLAKAGATRAGLRSSGQPAQA